MRAFACTPHPEVAAKRPSKDVGRGAGACILRGSWSLSSGRPLRAGPVGSHLRMRGTAKGRANSFYLSSPSLMTVEPDAFEMTKQSHELGAVGFRQRRLEQRLDVRA